jgi:hypothetical protein
MAPMPKDLLCRTSLDSHSVARDVIFYCPFGTGPPSLANPARRGGYRVIVSLRHNFLPCKPIPLMDSHRPPPDPVEAVINSETLRRKMLYVVSLFVFVKARP